MTHITITINKNDNPEKEIKIKTKVKSKNLGTIFLQTYKKCLIYADEHYKMKKGCRLKTIEFFEDKKN